MPRPNKRPLLTHFLAIPLTNIDSRPALESSLSTFKRRFARHPQYANVTGGRAVRPPGCIHLTLGVMSLEDESKVEEAANLLQQLDFNQLLCSTIEAEGLNQVDLNQVESSGSRDVLSSKPTTILPIIISMRSLESMHNPYQTSVLYCSPQDPSDRLLPLCQSIRDTFIAAGLLVPEDRPLKLHATILNTIYAGDGKRPRGQGKRKAQEKFDATEMLAEMEGFEWAQEVKLDRVSICKMGAVKRIVDGEIVDEEYEEVASVKLPE